MLRGIHKYLDKSNWDDAREALKHEDLSVPGGFGQWTPLHIGENKIVCFYLKLLLLKTLLLVLLVMHSIWYGLRVVSTSSSMTFKHLHFAYNDNLCLSKHAKEIPHSISFNPWLLQVQILLKSLTRVTDCLSTMQPNVAHPQKSLKHWPRRAPRQFRVSTKTDSHRCILR